MKKIAVIQFAMIALLAVSAAAEPIRVLFISGRNNHKWKLTTPALKKAFEDSGRFKVTVTEKPSEITAKMLEDYDLIFNGWTGFPKTKGHLWGLDTEKAIDDYFGLEDEEFSDTDRVDVRLGKVSDIEILDSAKIQERIANAASKIAEKKEAKKKKSEDDEDEDEDDEDGDDDAILPDIGDDDDDDDDDQPIESLDEGEKPDDAI